MQEDEIEEALRDLVYEVDPYYGTLPNQFTLAEFTSQILGLTTE